MAVGAVDGRQLGLFNGGWRATLCMLLCQDSKDGRQSFPFLLP